MARHELPDPAYVRERLDYDPDTGRLFWKAHESMRVQWNARYPGTEAFTAVDNRTGYQYGGLDGRTYLKHRVAWACATGSWPEHTVDHINGDTGDNRLSNLRAVPHADNSRNQRRRKDNISGVTGVRFDEKSQSWTARIKYNYRQRHIGSFRTLEEASAARRAAELEYNFHPNHGRSV